MSNQLPVKYEVTLAATASITSAVDLQAAYETVMIGRATMAASSTTFDVYGANASTDTFYPIYNGTTLFGVQNAGSWNVGPAGMRYLKLKPVTIPTANAVTFTILCTRY